MLISWGNSSSVAQRYILGSQTASAFSWLPFFQPIQTSGLLCALLNVILVCVSVSAPREPFCFLSLSWFSIPHFLVCPLFQGGFLSDLDQDFEMNVFFFLQHKK